MPERAVVIARELTKIYEDFVRGVASELAARAADLVARGEVTLFIAPAAHAEIASADDVRAAIARLRADGWHLKEIAKHLARETGWSARDVYRLGLEEDPP